MHPSYPGVVGRLGIVPRPRPVVSRPPVGGMYVPVGGMYVPVGGMYVPTRPALPQSLDPETTPAG